MPNDSVTAADLLGQIEAGVAPVILDVRSRWEFRRGHVPGAVHVPFWKILNRRLHLSLSPDHPIVVYCKHGPRAWLVGAALRRRGVRCVVYLEGHMSRWRRARLPEESDICD